MFAWLSAHPWTAALIAVGVFAAIVVVLDVVDAVRQRRLDREVDTTRATLNPERQTPRDADDARDRAQADVRRQMSRERDPR